MRTSKRSTLGLTAVAIVLLAVPFHVAAVVVAAIGHDRGSQLPRVL